MAALPLAPFSIERMFRPVELVRERLRRATAALERAGVRYAVTGGNAVAAWVTRVDPAAVRFTPDIDILVTRTDLDAVRAALEPEGFVYRRAAGVDMFLDGPDAKARDAVHVLFASEKVRPQYTHPAPSLEETEAGQEYRVLTLDALVRMKLTSLRLKDNVHIRDMIDVGLIDATWPARLPADLAERLQQILDTPED